MVFVPLPRTHHALHHAQLVIAVHDNELFRPAEQRGVAAQDAVANAVKGAHPQLAKRTFQRGFETLTHFACGFIGKGERQQTVRRDVFNRHQPLHPLHEDTGFTAARPGDDAQGARRMGDGFALAFVQAVQDFADIHMCSPQKCGHYSGCLRQLWYCLPKGLDTPLPARHNRAPCFFFFLH